MTQTWMIPARRKVRAMWMRAVVRASIARQIRHLRQSRGWTQEELAAQLDTSASCVSRFENPLRCNVTIKTLIKIAHIFDVALIVRFAGWVTFVTAYGTFGPPLPFASEQMEEFIDG